MSWLYFVAITSAMIVMACSGSVHITDGDSLSEYLCSPSGSIAPDTQLVITVPVLNLPIREEGFCRVENTTNIAIIASDQLINESRSYVSVICNSHTGFGFFNVTNLTIRSVYFENCESAVPTWSVKYVNESGQTLYYSTDILWSSLIFNHCHNITLYNVLPHSSSNITVGMIGINLCGFSNISAVMSGTHPNTSALIYYIDSAVSAFPSECSLHVSSNVYSNTADYNVRTVTDIYNYVNEFYVVGNTSVSTLAGMGYALTVCLAQQTFKVSADINIKQIYYASKMDQYVVNSVLVFFINVVTNSEVTFQGYPFDTYYEDLIPVILTTVLAETRTHNSSFSNENLMSISNTAFPHGQSAVDQVLLSIIAGLWQSESSFHVRMNYVSMYNNNQHPVSSLNYLFEVMSHGKPFNLTMTNTYLIDYNYYSNDYMQDSGIVLMSIYQVNVLMAGKTIFHSRGGGTAIDAEGCNLTVTGNFTIFDDYSYSSNGISLASNSTLILKEPLEMKFHNTRASQGSAIYAVVKADLSEVNTVQIQPSEDHQSLDADTNINIALSFFNSSSSGINTQVYAPQLNFLWDQFALFNRTTWDPIHSQYAYTTLIAGMFKEISDYDLYTSLSNGICLQVHGQPPWKCSYIDLPYYTYKHSHNLEQAYLETISVRPGGIAFSVPVLASGMEMYSSHFDNTDISLSSCFNPVKVKNGSNMVYKVYACPVDKFNFQPEPYYVDLTLSIANEPIDELPFIKLRVYSSCPTGFQLKNEVSCQCHCVCRQALQERGYTCDISTSLFTAPLHIWTGVEENNQTKTDTIMLSKHCPPHYCKRDIGQFPIDSTLTSLSCLSNRAGVLCGQCKENHSAVFGSDACYDNCSNLYLLTLPAYALAGIFLVVVLFVLRLTVATGTINGVIFYANILGLVVDNLTKGNDGMYLSILRIVVSLLNLELGFPVCLYEGMSPAAAVGFRFVFPVYLWSIVIGMVILSKYSIRLSNLISKSSVQVLATLFYLSFSSLLRTVITVISSTTIQLNNHNKETDLEWTDYRVVWYYDGLEYGHGLHGLYLALAGVFVLVFLFPFTLFTTFSYYLTRFGAVNKFRQFIDAYGGPFKDKWRFWFGLRLWITIILSSISGALQGSDTNTMYIIHHEVIITFIVFQSYIRPYKNFFVGLLDIFYMVNYFLLLESHFLVEEIFIECYMTIMSVVILAIFLTTFYHIWCAKCLQYFISRMKTKTYARHQDEIVQEDGDNESDRLLLDAAAAKEQDSI